jgi:alpha-L-arabinofuranosidase
MWTMRSLLPGLLATGAGFLLTTFPASSQGPLAVYTDTLVNGFQDWGWATRDYANTTSVHSGNRSIAVTFTGTWQGLQIYHPDMNSTPYTSLSFWIHGGASGGQRLQVYGLLHVGSNPNAGQGLYASLGTLTANTWQRFVIPLSTLGVANKANFTGFVIQDRIGSVQPTFYVDDVELVAAPVPALVHVNVAATQEVRAVDARFFAVNTAIWDSHFDTSSTISLLKEMGTRVLRCPGGSLSDEYHWSTDTTLNNTWRWVTSFANFVHVATNIDAQAFITVNYGTGSPNEAAAWVAYANGFATNTLSLGVDPRGTNWQTVGYWAALRAAAPLSRDDGRNFLRLSRAAPFGFKYWEIGNECFGTWETDSNTYPHDAYTYAVRARSYSDLMKAVDPAIRVGIVVTPGEDSSSNGYTSHPAVNARTGQTHNGWTPVLLTTLKNLGVTPDFAVHHYYPQWTDQSSPAGANSDIFLLQCATNWAAAAADLRQQISDYSGAAGTNIELVVTENNSDAGAQGIQSTSLVNGLYYADSFGQLMQTEFNAFVWWDLRNGTDTSGWFDSSLYGWRTYGDLGMINGLSTKHPAFYTAKLMRCFLQPGDRILRAGSDYPLLSAYAARGANGAVSVLVLNKSLLTNLNAAVALDGFVPGPTATTLSFGIPQDEAARTNGPAPAQDISTNSFSAASTLFTNSFPRLSMTLLRLTPAPPKLVALSPAETGGVLVLQLQGQAAVRYCLEWSTNLAAWTSAATNTLVGTTLNYTNAAPVGPGKVFWRAVWQP